MGKAKRSRPAGAREAASKRRASDSGSGKVVFVPHLGDMIMRGESVRCRDGVLGRVEDIAPYQLIPKNLQPAVQRARRDEDYILVRKYEPAPRTATPTDGAPAPAKLNLGNKTVWLPAADIEDIIVVAHATEHIGVPLNGLKDVYVIDRVSGRTVPAGKWAARPEDGEHGRLMGRPTLLLSRTSKVLRWRYCLRSQVYALLSGDAVSSVAADKTGIGYATKKLAIDAMDWDIIKRLVGCADDGGAALTRCVESSGESKKWSLRPDDVMNVRRGASTTIQTINLTSDAQLEDVTGALGSLWNVGVKASLLDGSESTEVGFEDPERADDADECVAWTLNAVVGHDVFDGSTPLEEPTEPETADAKDDAVTRPPGCRKPNKTQLEWVGKFFDDDGAVWQVDDIRYDEKEKQYLVFTVRVQPPPPEDRDSDDMSWYNWAEIPRFRHSFSKQLRLRAVRYERAPKSPGLRLRYVSTCDGRGGHLTVSVYWRTMSVAELGGRSLSRAFV